MNAARDGVHISRRLARNFQKSAVKTILTRNDDKFLSNNFRRIPRSFIKLLQPHCPLCTVHSMHSKKNWKFKLKKLNFSFYRSEWNLSYVFGADWSTTSATKANILRNGWNTDNNRPIVCNSVDIIVSLSLLNVRYGCIPDTLQVLFVVQRLPFHFFSSSNFLFRLFILSIGRSASGKNHMCSIRHRIFEWG